MEASDINKIKQNFMEGLQRRVTEARVQEGVVRGVGRAVNRGLNKVRYAVKHPIKSFLTPFVLHRAVMTAVKGGRGKKTDEGVSSVVKKVGKAAKKITPTAGRAHVKKTTQRVRSS
jgi:hypothetical protein